MKRSTFLTITSAISALFGGMMFVLPDMVAVGFDQTHSSFSLFLMREMGLIIIASGVLNFLVRNDKGTATLSAVFIFNITYHIIMVPIVFMGVSQGVFTIDKSIGGLAAHLFIGIGSIIYLMKTKSPTS